MPLNRSLLPEATREGRGARDAPQRVGRRHHSWHLFILRLRPELLTITRDEFIEELKTAGIGTSVHFIPLQRRPFYVR